jgi:hypothetical protein
MNQAEPKLTREMLEAVLDRAKLESDFLHAIEIKTRTQSKGRLSAGLGPWDEWQDFFRLIEQSPALKAAVDAFCDLLKPNPETMREEQLRTYSGTELESLIRQINPEELFRPRVLTTLQLFFRAGWEARGAAEQAEQLRRMTE